MTNAPKNTKRDGLALHGRHVAADWHLDMRVVDDPNESPRHAVACVTKPNSPRTKRWTRGGYALVNAVVLGSHNVAHEAPPMDEDQRDTFLRYNREQMETAAVDALKHGMDRPLVLGLNVEDPTAKMVACKFASPQEIDQRLSDCRRNKTDACVILPIPHDDAVRLCGDMTENSVTILASEVPDGCFRFLIITTGGFRWGFGKIAT